MDSKIDYLSWTIKPPPGYDGVGDITQDSVIDITWDFAPHFAAWASNFDQWRVTGGRGHYGASLLQPDTFAREWYGGHANHILIEMPGTACAAAHEAGCLFDITADAAQRCTRLDIACDIQGEITPQPFVEAGYNTRFKSHASIVSESGRTEYVGSMKSERYARVYRYAPPHPRADTMRVEHVFRSKYAKSAVRSLLEQGVEIVAAMCGNTWGWQSPAWTLEGSTFGKIRAQRADKHEPGRLRWLYGVCLPAVAKAHREGLLDAHEWAETLLSAL